MSLVVVSELSSHGEFWAQVAIEDEDEEDHYKTMAEELQYVFPPPHTHTCTHMHTHAHTHIPNQMALCSH